MLRVMDLFPRRDTRYGMRMSDTYVCLMPYEQKLQQQADVSGGPSAVSASRVRPSLLSISSRA